jgi:hypothetical protein
MQQYAQRISAEVEMITIDFDVVNPSHVPKTLDSIAITGLVLKGARWDSATNRMQDLEPNSLPYNKLPPLLCTPTKTSKTFASNVFHYPCALYKSSAAGDCNFVTNIKLPTDYPEKHW